MKDLNYEKIQNDDYKLDDLIKDKYERKKFCDSKKSDPMTLIIQGKSPQKDEDSFREVEEDCVDSRYIFFFNLNFIFLFILFKIYK